MADPSSIHFHIGRSSLRVYSNCRFRTLPQKAKWLEAEDRFLKTMGFVELGPVKILRARLAALRKNREIQRANQNPQKDDKNLPATQLRHIKWLAALVPLFMLVMLEIFSLTEPIRESASTMYNWFLGIDFINNLIKWW